MPTGAAEQLYPPSLSLLADLDDLPEEALLLNEASNSNSDRAHGVSSRGAPSLDSRPPILASLNSSNLGAEMVQLRAAPDSTAGPVRHSCDIGLLSHSGAASEVFQGGLFGGSAPHQQQQAASGLHGGEEGGSMRGMTVVLTPPPPPPRTQSGPFLNHAMPPPPPPPQRKSISGGMPSAPPAMQAATPPAPPPPRHRNSLSGSINVATTSPSSLATPAPGPPGPPPSLQRPPPPPPLTTAAAHRWPKRCPPGRTCSPGASLTHQAATAPTSASRSPAASFTHCPAASPTAAPSKPPRQPSPGAGSQLQPPPPPPPPPPRTSLSGGAPPPPPATPPPLRPGAAAGHPPPPPPPPPGGATQSAASGPLLKVGLPPSVIALGRHKHTTAVYNPSLPSLCPHTPTFYLLCHPQTPGLSACRS